MSTTLISPGPVTPITQSVIYALPASPCIITSGAIVQKSASFGGTYSDWVGSTGGIYHGGSTVQSHVKCLTGNTTIQAVKVKMTGPFSKGSYSESVAKSGPSNYWMLNETTGLIARDSIGGANGTISGGVVLNGVNGMTFDGVNGQIVTVSGNLLQVFTFELWVKSTVLPINKALLVIGPPYLGTSTGRWRIYNPTNTLADAIGIRTFDDGQWHHIVVIQQPTSVTGYVDGILDAVVNITSTFTGVPTDTFNIGCALGYGGHYFNGSLKDVAVYPRALTPSEILSHYQSR